MKLMIGLIAASAIVGGCKFQTIPTPKPQKELRLKEDWQFPLEEDDQKLRLQTSEKFSLTYSPATLLLLNENLDAKELVPVLEAVEEVRQSQSEYLTKDVYGLRLKYREDIKKLNDEISGLRGEIARIEKEARDSDDAASEKRLQDTANWFSKVVDKEVSDESKKERLQSIFEDYCEAKIWELATNKVFTQRKYLKRPSPMQFCEDVYQTSSRGFFQGEVCENAEDQSVGKSYLQCIWVEGVLKTKWFASGGALSQSILVGDKTVNLKDYLGSLIKDPSFEEILARKKYDPQTGVGAVGSYFISEKQDKLGFIKKLRSTKCSTNQENKRYLAIPDLCTVFKTRSKDTPDSLIKYVEEGRKDFNIPLTPAPSGEFVFDGYTYTHASLLQYSKLMKYFGHREWAGQSELDQFFHQGTEDQIPLPSSTKSNERAHKIGVESSDEVRDLYCRFMGNLCPLKKEQTPEDVAELKRLNDKILATETMIDDIRKKQKEASVYAQKADKDKTLASQMTWSPYLPFSAEKARDVWSDELMNLAGTDACEGAFEKEFAQKRFQGGGVPIALVSKGMSIKLSRDQDELSFDLWFGDSGRESFIGHIKGCASYSNGNTVECEAPLNDKTLPASEFTFDRSTGRMTFVFDADLEDPVTGKGFLQYQPMGSQWCQKETDLQMIPEEDLVDRKVELVVYPDMQDEHLQILTGKVVIKGPDHKETDIRYEHEGAVSAISKN